MLYLAWIALIVTPVAFRGGLGEVGAAVVLGAAAGVAVFLRARYPYLLTVCAWAMALAVTQMLLIPALFSLGVRRRNWLSLGAVVASVIVLMITFGRGERLVTFQGVRIDAFSETWAWALNAVVVAVIPYALGLSLNVRRELLVSYEQRAVLAEQERLASDREAVLLERERISGEMHDILGHKLALISMQAGALEVNASAGAAQVEQQARKIGESARDGLTDLRTIVGALGQASRPSLEPRGLPAIQALVDESRASGAVVDLDMAGVTDAGEMPEDVGRAAYRIIQEALTNAHRHAPGAPVTIILAGSPGDDVTVDVANSAERGAGPRASISPTGRGIPSLRERARSVGGSLAAEFDQDMFRLKAVLPWPSSAEASR